MKKSSFLFFLIVILYSSGSDCQSFPRIGEAERITMLNPPKGKVRMVLDTDTYNEIDDQFAVVYALLSREQMDVEALYAAPFSNSRSDGPEDGMEKSYDEILRLLERLDIDPDGFVFKGSKDYLEDLSNPERSPAVLDLIERAKTASPENPLYVVAVGAITNVSSALALEPSIIHNMVVVWLGGNGFTWPHTREFNFKQDLNASRLIFDSGVPFVQFPCTPVVDHFTTTVPEMETYLEGQGEIAEYLLEIFKDHRKDHFAWSKVLWDMTAVAYLVNPDWTPSNLVHSPIITDQYTYSFDDSRHLIRVVYNINRDRIFKDFFRKIERTNKLVPGQLFIILTIQASNNGYLPVLQGCAHSDSPFSFSAEQIPALHVIILQVVQFPCDFTTFIANAVKFPWPVQPGRMSKQCIQWILWNTAGFFQSEKG